MSVAEGAGDRARRLVDRIAVRWGVLELIDDVDIEDAVLRIEEVVSAEVAERVGALQAAARQALAYFEGGVYLMGTPPDVRALCDGLRAALATAGAPGSQEDGR